MVFFPCTADHPDNQRAVYGELECRSLSIASKIGSTLPGLERAITLVQKEDYDYHQQHGIALYG